MRDKGRDHQTWQSPAGTPPTPTLPHNGQGDEEGALPPSGGEGEAEALPPCGGGLGGGTPIEAIDRRVLGAPLPHESARTHVTGEAAFLDDTPPARGELFVDFVGSPLARGRITGI